MKRILALLLALIMLLTLAACGKDEESTPTGESTGATTNTTESTNDPTDGTQSTTEGGSEGTESTKGTTSANSTTSTSEPAETSPTENCDHTYKESDILLGEDCIYSIVYICSKCQHSYKEKTEKIGHETKTYYSVQPSPTVEGFQCEECKVCGQKETKSVGKAVPSGAYDGNFYLFLDSDSPYNTELYTWQGKAKRILYCKCGFSHYDKEETIFTQWGRWTYDITDDDIQKIKNSSHYDSTKKAFIPYDPGDFPPVWADYIGYTDNGDGTATLYTTFEVRTNGQYVESGYCKVQVKYVVPSTNELMANYRITSIMRVESIPTNLTK